MREERLDGRLGMGCSEQGVLVGEIAIRGRARNGGGLGRGLDRRRQSLGDQLTGRGHQGLAGALFLRNPTVELVGR
ncbi:hypothetical protein D3C83_161420 [compost metagenome]